MDKKILIYGASSFARQMRFYFEADSEYVVTHFVVDKKYHTSNHFDNLPLLDIDNLPQELSPKYRRMFVAVGYKNMGARAKVYAKANAKGYQLVNYVSSSAKIAEGVLLGKNNVFLSQVVVEPFTEVGDNNIFWSNATVCHDSKIGSHCFVAANAVIGGACEIGSACFFGFNSTLREELTVGDNVFVGAASYLSKDAQSNSKCLGVPAKVEILGVN